MSDPDCTFWHILEAFDGVCSAASAALFLTEEEEANVTFYLSPFEKMNKFWPQNLYIYKKTHYCSCSVLCYMTIQM